MAIRAEHLNFLYGEGTVYEQYALKDVNFEIEDGQFIGLIGHTGSGKSTLIQHLNGLLRASSGALYYNGENIYQDGYDMKKLRSKVGLVFQYPEHQLFEVDVFSDVCFGPRNQGLEKEEIEQRAREALQQVGLEERFWTQSPFELSGGQKQRISIARVFLKNPPILILDEATSALDNESERWIQRSLEELSQNRTTITIAHRLSTIRDADEIIVITEDGIAERGTHEELLDMNGVYAAYYNM